MQLGFQLYGGSLGYGGFQGWHVDVGCQSARDGVQMCCAAEHRLWSLLYAV